MTQSRVYTALAKDLNGGKLANADGPPDSSQLQSANFYLKLQLSSVPSTAFALEAQLKREGV